MPALAWLLSAARRGFYPEYTTVATKGINVEIEGLGDAGFTGAEHPAGVDCDVAGQDTELGLGADHSGDLGQPWPPADADPHPSLVIDTPYGPEPVGPATEDTGGDGRPDTAIVPTSDGLLLVTDTNGDTTADQIVDIDNAGAVTVSHYSGPGHWTVASSGTDLTGQPVTGAPAIGSDDSDWVFEEITHVMPGEDGMPQDSDSVWA